MRALFNFQPSCDAMPYTQELGHAVAILYNATKDQPCLKLELSGPAGGPGLRTWLYQTCTELMPQEQPFFPANGRTDMFWDQGVWLCPCPLVQNGSAVDDCQAPRISPAPSRPTAQRCT